MAWRTETGLWSSLCLGEGTPFSRSAVIDTDPDLAVIRASQAAGLLAFDADGPDALLGDAWFINIEGGIGVTQNVGHIVLELLQNGVIGPGQLADKFLQGAHDAAVDGFGDVLDATTVTAAE